MTYSLVLQNWPSEEFSNKGKEKRMFFNLLKAFSLGLQTGGPRQSGRFRTFTWKVACLNTSVYSGNRPIYFSQLKQRWEWPCKSCYYQAYDNTKVSIKIKSQPNLAYTQRFRLLSIQLAYCDRPNRANYPAYVSVAWIGVSIWPSQSPENSFETI